MFPVIPKPGVRFELFNKEYLILKNLPNSKIEAEDQRFKDAKIFTHAELIKYLSNGDLKFECRGKNTAKSDDILTTSFNNDNIEDSKFKEQAQFRFEVIKPILGLGIAKRRNAILARIEEVNSWSDNPKTAKDKLNGCNYYHEISYTNIYKWIREYQEANGDIRSLIPSYHNSGGKNRTRLNAKVVEFINESIDEFYKTGQRVSTRELWFDIVYKISQYNKFSPSSLSIPSYETITRHVSKIPIFDSVSKRIGNRTSENRFGGLGNGVVVNYALERVELDHTPVDILLVDENGKVIERPYLILGIDRFTRHVLGFSIGIGNNVGWPEVMQCIKHIMTDKSYVKEIYPFIRNDWDAFGIPKTIVIDNGLEFKNNPMKDAAYQLGFVLQFCEPQAPQCKGSIERFFGTANTGLFHNMPGTTRSNPKELGDDEKPSKSACLTFSTFIAIVHKWIIDVYSQDINRGAGGKPADLWKYSIENHPVSWPNSVSEIAILLGRTAERKITRKGIAILNETYNNSKLNQLLHQFSVENNGFEESFQVKYDPMDIGEVYVFDKLISKKWIRVECTNYEYAKNLSEWEHKEILAYAKTKLGTVDIESLAQSKFELRKMFENERINKKGDMRRIKRINSENEINQRLADMDNATAFSLNNSSNEKVNNSISDVGYRIEAADDVLITESFTREKFSENSIKVIDIDTRNISKQNIRRASNRSKEKEIELDIDSFEGYGYASDLLGERPNE